MQVNTGTMAETCQPGSGCFLRMCECVAHRSGNISVQDLLEQVCLTAIRSRETVSDGCVVCGKVTPYRKRLTLLPQSNGLLRASVLLTKAIGNRGTGERSPLCPDHWSQYHYSRRRHWVQLSEGLPEEQTLAVWLIRHGLKRLKKLHQIPEARIKETIPERSKGIPNALSGDAIDLIQWKNRISRGHFRDVDWIDIFDYTDDESIRRSFATYPYELAGWLDMNRPANFRRGLSQRKRDEILWQRRPPIYSSDNMRRLLNAEASLRLRLPDEHELTEQRIKLLY
jgi:hypothetical protein